MSDDEASANLTLAVRLKSKDGHSLAESFHFFEHAYPIQIWHADQTEPIEIHGWTECPPGRYVIDVLLMNPRTDDHYSASRVLTVPATQKPDPLVN